MESERGEVQFEMYIVDCLVCNEIKEETLHSIKNVCNGCFEANLITKI